MEIKISGKQLAGMLDVLTIKGITNTDTLTITEGEMIITDEDDRVIIKSTRFLNPPNEEWLITSKIM